MQFHPDTQQSKNLSQEEIDANHEKFVQINTAYEILSKRTERKKYDAELRDQKRRETYAQYGHEDMSKMTMEDRAKVYGYYRDVYFK